MIKNLVRGTTALAPALSPLALPSAAAAAPMAPAAAAQVLNLADAVDLVPVADESRTGYTRDKFKHWNTGLDAADGELATSMNFDGICGPPHEAASSQELRSRTRTDSPSQRSGTVVAMIAPSGRPGPRTTARLR